MKLIPLTRGQVAKVSDEDFVELSKVKWLAHYSKVREVYYAAREQKGRFILMHREIMKAPEGIEVDHANLDTLDNTRANLRLATRTQQCWNRNKPNQTGFKGIFRNKPGCFTARITFNKKRITLGTYPTPELAAQAYNQGAVRYFGEFARLNPV